MSAFHIISPTDSRRGVLLEGRNHDLAKKVLEKMDIPEAKTRETLFALLVELDETPTKKHLPKLASFFSEIENLEILSKYYRMFLSTKALKNKDINQYPNFAAFEHEVDANALVTDLDVANRGKEILDAPVYADANVKIYKGDTPTKCIRYGKGYPFCISRPLGDGNMFYNYRRQGYIFYFCINDNLPETDRHRMTVVGVRENYGEVSYNMTTANNDDTREVTMEEIISQTPQLKPAFADGGVFAAVPLRGDEKTALDLPATCSLEKYLALPLRVQVIWLHANAGVLMRDGDRREEKFSKYCYNDVLKKVAVQSTPYICLSKRDYSYMKTHRDLYNAYIKTQEIVIRSPHFRGLLQQRSYGSRFFNPINLPIIVDSLGGMDKFASLLNSINIDIQTSGQVYIPYGGGGHDADVAEKIIVKAQRKNAKEAVSDIVAQFAVATKKNPSTTRSVVLASLPEVAYITRLLERKFNSAEKVDAYYAAGNFPVYVCAEGASVKSNQGKVEPIIQRFTDTLTNTSAGGVVGGDLTRTVKLHADQKISFFSLFKIESAFDNALNGLTDVDTLHFNTKSKYDLQLLSEKNITKMSADKVSWLLSAITNSVEMSDESVLYNFFATLPDKVKSLIQLKCRFGNGEGTIGRRELQVHKLLGVSDLQINNFALRALAQKNVALYASIHKGTASLSSRSHIDYIRSHLPYDPLTQSKTDAVKRANELYTTDAKKVNADLGIHLPTVPDRATLQTMLYIIGIRQGNSVIPYKNKSEIPSLRDAFLEAMIAISLVAGSDTYDAVRAEIQALSPEKRKHFLSRVHAVHKRTEAPQIGDAVHYFCDKFIGDRIKELIEKRPEPAEITDSLLGLIYSESNALHSFVKQLADFIQVDCKNAYDYAVKFAQQASSDDARNAGISLGMLANALDKLPPKEFENKLVPEVVGACEKFGGILALTDWKSVSSWLRNPHLKLILSLSEND